MSSFFKCRAAGVYSIYEYIYRSGHAVMVVGRVKF